MGAPHPGADAPGQILPSPPGFRQRGSAAWEATPVAQIPRIRRTGGATASGGQAPQGFGLRAEGPAGTSAGRIGLTESKDL